MTAPIALTAALQAAGTFASRLAERDAEPTGNLFSELMAQAGRNGRPADRAGLLSDRPDAAAHAGQPARPSASQTADRQRDVEAGRRNERQAATERKRRRDEDETRARENREADDRRDAARSAERDAGIDSGAKASGGRGEGSPDDRKDTTSAARQDGSTDTSVSGSPGIAGASAFIASAPIGRSDVPGSGNPVDGSEAERSADAASHPAIGTGTGKDGPQVADAAMQSGDRARGPEGAMKGDANGKADGANAPGEGSEGAGGDDAVAVLRAVLAAADAAAGRTASATSVASDTSGASGSTTTAAASTPSAGAGSGTAASATAPHGATAGGATANGVLSGSAQATAGSQSATTTVDPSTTPASANTAMANGAAATHGMTASIGTPERREAASSAAGALRGGRTAAPMSGAASAAATTAGDALSTADAIAARGTAGSVGADAIVGRDAASEAGSASTHAGDGAGFAASLAAAQTGRGPDVRANPAGVMSASIAAPIDQPEFAEALARQAATLVVQGHTRAEIQVTPADMGPIRIRIDLAADAATIGLTADQAGTRQAIEASLPMLRNLLAEQGLRLAETRVDGRADTPGTLSDSSRHPAGQESAANTQHGNDRNLAGSGDRGDRPGGHAGMTRDDGRSTVSRGDGRPGPGPGGADRPMVDRLPLDGRPAVPGGFADRRIDLYA